MSNPLNLEITALAPSALIELFVLEIPNSPIARFHTGTNKLNVSVVWQGDGSLDPNSAANVNATYAFFPIEATGFDVSGQGSFPTPTIRVGNVTGLISALTLRYDDLILSKLTRKRTFAKFLDPINFPEGVNATANPAMFLEDDVYFVQQKVAENIQMVEFKLASILDVEGVNLPRRQVNANNCNWVYRSSECSFAVFPPWSNVQLYVPPEDPLYMEAGVSQWLAFYNGKNYRCVKANAGIPPSASRQFWSEDFCKKTLRDCKLRFGANSPLPIGMFPGATKVPYIG